MTGHNPSVATLFSVKRKSLDEQKPHHSQNERIKYHIAPQISANIIDNRILSHVNNEMARPDSEGGITCDKRSPRPTHKRYKGREENER